MQHGAVFDGAGHDMFAVRFKLQHRVDDRVIRFRPTAGEHNFRRLASQQRRQSLPGKIDSFSRFRGKGVAARRVAVTFPQKRQHFLDHRRVERRGRIVIEINDFAVSHDHQL